MGGTLLAGLLLGGVVGAFLAGDAGHAPALAAAEERPRGLINPVDQRRETNERLAQIETELRALRTLLDTREIRVRIVDDAP